MKKSAFFLAALCSGSLLVASCNSDKAADSTATTTETTTAEGTASGDMAGMDHSAGATGSAAAGDSPQLVAMNEMMQKMHASKPKGNTDHDFAHHMLEHHKGAVVMADIQLRDGKDATMRQMAEKIKADQQKEIAELEAAATRLDNAPTNYKPNDPTDPFTSKMKASMDAMMPMPKSVADPDMNFNMLMTMHHQSAVDMAKAELAHGKDTKLKQMAQQIIDAQEKEIAAFKDWHNKNADKM
ncbi:DUF305 domain-containing protein [Hymenobacter sp. ISL-91]|uniref:DUF305 domain-containing protein n=1 Tax=Hymenobacter sublimis TaxID=2933777 RepID=A0ABY4JH07_9BACT|nr:MULTISPECIES: DUF305 domain-containing protein [Hymenobacter]MBT2559291.1 DUF305 domain-containing protein [Hymenobacter sp. ISL-91]UPL51333.1 DUF305 domain-containing protein [Hymenobacter sublimis]